MLQLLTLRTLASKAVTIPIGQISVFKNPGQMPGLSDEIIDELVVEALQVAADAFEVDVSEKNPVSLRDHLLNVDLLAIVDDGDAVIGFASCRTLDDDGVLFLHGIAISPDFKGRGIANALFDAVCSEVSLARVAFTTQNPVMYSFLKKKCAHVIPSLEDRDVPMDIQPVGLKIIGNRGRIDLDTFIVHELYESCRYPALPESDDPKVNEWFSQALSTKDGKTRDGFVFVGER